ncbi:hypothetical protein HJC23_001655 [Cyclotella cryptica]|uniref:Spindle pole body component n=1 Tax=Cyclotella cryptica TaxID=29204 RepID=A0ABD3QLE0_9STRA|eukprot:CCRYP_004689-RB/>CCRYP_004689-RB protein AED:0.02 eAED:0.02 QI:167/-1/1/1/-1/1/1/289/1447
MNSSSNAALRAAVEARQRHSRASRPASSSLMAGIQSAKAHSSGNATKEAGASSVPVNDTTTANNSSNNEASSTSILSPTTRESSIPSSSLRSAIHRAEADLQKVMEGIHSPPPAPNTASNAADVSMDSDVALDDDAAAAHMQTEMRRHAAAGNAHAGVDTIVHRSRDWNVNEYGGGERDDSLYRPSVGLPPRPRRVVSHASTTQQLPPLPPQQHNVQRNPSIPTSTPHATPTGLSTPLRRPVNNANGTTSHLPAASIYATPNAAYEALPPRFDDDDTNNHDNDNTSSNHSPDEPKTPLTQMRSIRMSITKDRSEMDEIRRRPLFEETPQHTPLPTKGVPNNAPTNHDVIMDDGETDDNHHHHHEEEHDEYDTEEAIHDSFHHREYTSSCLRYGSEILLRFRSPTALTSLSVQPVASTVDRTTAVERVCLIANETHGRLGREENRFVILGGGSPTDEEVEDASASYVCYGDVITLRSSVLNRVLGVQKMEVMNAHGEGSSVTLKVGCFRRYGLFPQSDQWIVLRGGANAGLVQLGRDLPHEDRGRIPVYSGDPIVLRNDMEGGLLSLGSVVDDLTNISSGPDIVGWSLNLITSSYQMHDGTASTEDDVELIEFLHRHNQCRPGKKETFQIFTANVPPCPDWLYPADEGKDRCFLDGSYLSNPNRHFISPELEDEMWNEASYHQCLECDGSPKRLASLSADIQEAILLEEVIGAMMGLEGQLIRYHPGDLNSSNDQDGEYQTQPGFVFAPLAVTGGKIDTSLEEIVSMILPLCSNYVCVNNYVQSCLCNYECGIIARALSEAMGKLLQEYLAFVSNLDYELREPSSIRKPLSMTMVHVRVQPASRTMSILYHVVYTVQGKKGGDLLNALQRLAKFHYSGDGKCNEILSHLMNVCAVQYTRMLKSWLNSGRLHDPYNEFMIEVTNRNFQSNSVVMREGIEFENWCRVHDVNVLMSLGTSSELISPTTTPFGVDRHRSTSHMSAVDKVHTTGKYRRAIHFCHEGVPVLPSTENEAPSEDDPSILLNPLKLSRYIDSSYHKASDLLLQMMLEKYNLMASLQLMKKYFLLDQGDFFVEFLDAAEEELDSNVSTLSRGRIQNAIATSIGRTSDFVLSSSSTDTRHASQLASALRCGFKKQSLVEELDEVHRQHSRGSSKGKSQKKELKGFEALQLEFKHIPFPTSLVLSHSQMRIYQFLFRQIFFAKYVERQLVGLWSDHQLMKQMSSLKAMRKTFCLRRRMIHFIQNFVYYIKFEVIEPNWIELETKLNAAKHHCSNPQTPQACGQFPRTVDDLLAEHNQFLISVITQCLLTNSDLIRASTKIMTTCLLFTNQMKLFMGTTKIDDHHETTRSECSKLRHSGQVKKKIDDARKSQFRLQREERTRRCSDRIVREVCTENFQHMIARFDSVFSAHLSDFMASLKCDYGRRSHDHFTNLFMQLDYNGFVSNSVQNA